MSLSLQELSDRIEIQDLIYRYSHYIDQKLFDELPKDVFTDDAHIDYSAFGGTVGDLASTIEFLKQSLPAFPNTQHLNANIQIELNGDEASGRVMCFNPMEMDLGEQGKQEFFIGLWYNDKYRRVNGEWRIAERSEEKSWVFNAPDFMGL